ncbi:MAG: SAM-dependent methyltransferase [Gammaproteobacteria bacterium]
MKRALTPEQRRPFWERIIGGIVGTRVLAGDEGDASTKFDSELAASNTSASHRDPEPGTVDTDETAASGRLGEVYIIGAGPGDPDLLTLRAVQLLQQADVHSLRSSRFRCRARSRPARRSENIRWQGNRRRTITRRQARIHELLVQYAKRGLRVARLKGGDPFIFGRGGEEIESLDAHGVPYVVVPGITAALAAAASASIPLNSSAARAERDVRGWVMRSTTRRSTGDRSGCPITPSCSTLGVAQMPRIVERLTAAGASPGSPGGID